MGRRPFAVATAKPSSGSRRRSGPHQQLAFGDLLREAGAMKGSLIRVVVAASVASAAWYAEAQPAERATQELSIVFNVDGDSRACSAESATQVTLESLVSGGEQWVGRCVRVDGFWSGRALFREAADPQRAQYPQSGDELSDRRVGLYLPDRLLRRAPDRPRSSTAVGVVGDCEILTRGALMVMGYCHYTSGPYIAVSEMLRTRR